MGRMNYVRVYSGTLAASNRIENASRHCEARVARVLQLYANKREDVKTCTAGDIVGIIGDRGAAGVCADEAQLIKMQETGGKSLVLHPASCILHPASCILHPARKSDN